MSSKREEAATVLLIVLIASLAVGLPMALVLIL